MCMQDYRIGNQMIYRIWTTSTTLDIPADSRRVGFWLSIGDGAGAKLRPKNVVRNIENFTGDLELAVATDKFSYIPIKITDIGQLLLGGWELESTDGSQVFCYETLIEDLNKNP